MSKYLGRFLGAALVISVAACQNDVVRPSPVPSGPGPSSPPAPGRTVSGTVRAFTDSGEGRPVANLHLKVRAREGAVGGADVVTDANGRYTLVDVSADVLYFQTAPGSEYRFLCDSYPVIVMRPSDLPVVHATWSGNRLPPGMWSVSTSVFGTVSERLGGTLRPVMAATVRVDGEPPVTTSATGFYMICSVGGTDQYWGITAEKTGYNPVTRIYLGGWDSEIHLELTRK